MEGHCILLFLHYTTPQTAMLYISELPLAMYHKTFVEESNYFEKCILHSQCLNAQHHKVDMKRTVLRPPQFPFQGLSLFTYGRDWGGKSTESTKIGGNEPSDSLDSNKLKGICGF